jgi:short-subunit dehydrogenase
MKDFKNKVAAITGAASGMGRTLSLELARRGCHLALSDVNEEGLNETANLARQQGVKVTTCRLDVAQRDAVYAWADQVATEHGKVNLVFNNAGVALTVGLDSVKHSDFEWIMGINFWGVVYGTQAFLPHLKRSGDGHIINISSLFGLMAVPTQGTYNAAKFAVRGYTEALRMELDIAHCGVSATCVHPGGIATNIAKSGRIDPSIEKATGVSVEKHRRQADKLINVTSPESAALQILKAVENNARRVLVGNDAKFLDKLIRLLGAGYQSVVVKRFKSMSAPQQR